MVEVVGFLFGSAGVWYWSEESVTHHIAPVSKQESSQWLTVVTLECSERV